MDEKRKEKEAELQEGDRSIEDSIADTMDIYGYTRSVGRIYALLYLHGEPMTLDDLRDELGMSKGSMSLGVRRLMDDKLIHRVFRKGERKDLYKAEEDYFKFFTSVFLRRWQREVSVNMEGIRQAQPQYEALIDDPDTPEDVREDAKRKLEKITGSLPYYDFLERIVAKTESGELFRMIFDEEKE
ncbi:GbsR/MarR family transcriptional regulator [Salicibibacter kimchii]|uniref:HTH-type transcriptional regulator n=1 Tax=Salicibibacter kimchii TaxID=2099786 RepID=A0A345C1V8_9BACI|nr:MarR family transcriptional regulator [Salicibibacter kimchii]AXF57189.1 GbsR/MarR family transcriptional regulator [Salicibibacter kimchii]